VDHLLSACDWSGLACCLLCFFFPNAPVEYPLRGLTSPFSTPLRGAVQCYPVHWPLDEKGFTSFRGLVGRPPPFRCEERAAVLDRY